MGKSKWIGGIGACTAPKNVLWPEHAKKHGEACSLKHQHLSTSDTALLDALGSYRPESMCLADRQEASISMTHISIECVSWQLQMQIKIHLRWDKLIASLTKLIASFAF